MKKLKLKKITISKLNNDQLAQIQGGETQGCTQNCSVGPDCSPDTVDPWCGPQTEQTCVGQTNPVCDNHYL